MARREKKSEIDSGGQSRRRVKLLQMALKARPDSSDAKMIESVQKLIRDVARLSDFGNPTEVEIDVEQLSSCNYLDGGDDTYVFFPARSKRNDWS